MCTDTLQTASRRLTALNGQLGVGHSCSWWSSGAVVQPAARRGKRSDYRDPDLGISLPQNQLASSSLQPDSASLCGNFESFFRSVNISIYLLDMRLQHRISFRTLSLYSGRPRRSSFPPNRRQMYLHVSCLDQKKPQYLGPRLGLGLGSQHAKLKCVSMAFGGPSFHFLQGAG